MGILIVIAAVNLSILYGLEQKNTGESYSIIRAGDLKQKTETVAALAASVANGNNDDREKLKAEIQDFETHLVHCSIFVSFLSFQQSVQLG